MESYSGNILHIANRLQVNKSMASRFSLPPPAPLEIHDPNVAERWKKFLLAWENYALATELNKKGEPVHVATLLTVIGEEAREVYSTFNDWAEDGDDKKIKPVLKKFGDYCEPRKNIPFEFKSQEKPTISTVQRYESQPRAVVLKQSRLMKSFVTASCLVFETTS